MKKLMAVLLAGVICTSALALASCGGGDNDITTGENKNPQTTQEAVKNPETNDDESQKEQEPTDTRTAQEIFDAIIESVKLKDDRIYLDFGARVTLTQENFNKLILEEQMNVDTDTYELVLDEDAIENLKDNLNYGGIGYGQEWIAEIEGYIQNKKTGDKSEPEMMVFTLRKSEEADKKLNPEG